MSQRTKASRLALNLQNCALLLCLCVPSLWMIANVPPLWRDVDAYNQLTRDPLISTFWGHGPAYSYAAKIPLFLGSIWERWRRIAPASAPTESSKMPLTDSGIALLISGQHLALGASALYFICAISASFWVRLGLALLWAGNALFYTFAHCVGSETLGLIFIVLFAAQAIRLVRSRREPRWIHWYIFAVALCGCILSRQINLCLTALLPAVFLISWARLRASALLGGRRKTRRAWAARHLRHAIIAVAVALSCLAVTSALPRYLARKTHLHPHSRLGYTFLWRLQFLDTLTPESRTALLHQIRLRARSTEVRALVAILEQLYREGRGLDYAAFTQRGLELFPGPLHWQGLDLALNQLAFLFLWPPVAELLQVAKADFLGGLKAPSTEVSSSLFHTTAYYFSNRETMPGCDNLVTFRGRSAAQLLSIPAQSTYFNLWNGITYRMALGVWLVALIALILTARQKNRERREVITFAIALAILGLLMFAASCFLADNQPRFRLPMWQLLFLSFSILVGRTADLIVLSSSRRPLNGAGVR